MFKSGDRVRRTHMPDDATPISKTWPVGEVRTVSYGFGTCFQVEGDHGYWRNNSFELITPEERLSQARAEVARIEAEIAEAAKPKVGDRLIKKGNIRAQCTATYELVAIIPYRLGEAYVTQCYNTPDDRDIPRVSSPDLWEKF